MPTGSTGQVCVQYSGAEFGSEYNGPVSSGVYWTNNSDGEQVPTSLVNVRAFPSQMSVSTYVNETIAYGINSSEGSNGLYEVGLFLFCPGVPLAVGYHEAELNTSDFAWALEVYHGCPFLALQHTIVGLTNIQAIFLPVWNRYTMTYNITGSSVLSFNPAPNVQNVTFRLQVQTFASPLNVSLSLNDSTVVRVLYDPMLTRSPANDSCSWYPNDSEALDGGVWTQFGQFGPGNMTIDAPSVQIPAYSIAIYTLSIKIASYSQAYYYALMPTISLAAPGGVQPALQSVAAYYPVNIGRSDFTGVAAQTLSGACS